MDNQKYPLLVDVKQAADISGYGTPGKFKRAVKQGKMPKPYDTGTRPHLWCRAEIEARVNPMKNSEEEYQLRKLEERLGMRSKDPEVEAIDKALGLD